jgi:predicted nucleic acid-binding protein
MILYLDTNVILARWAPQEAHHSDAKKILQAVEEGKAEAVTSTLTLLEVVSTTSRAFDRFKDAKPMKREEISGAYLKRVVNTRNLSLIPFGGDVTLNVDDRGVNVPALLAVALEVASKTGVKTLDNIHVASVYVASRISGHRVDYLVTLDEDMLRRRTEIEGLTGVKVAAPGELSSKLF